MAAWLYQLSEEYWSRNSYRLDIWEGERWQWPVTQIRGTKRPEPGDTVIFFYALAGCKEPGFYGWAVILLWVEAPEDKTMYFRPVEPSDQLKMHPWGDEDAIGLANAVRGKMPQATLWPIAGDIAAKIASGIKLWVGGKVPDSI